MSVSEQGKVRELGALHCLGYQLSFNSLVSSSTSLLLDVPGVLHVGTLWLDFFGGNPPWERDQAKKELLPLGRGPLCSTVPFCCCC